MRKTLLALLVATTGKVLADEAKELLAWLPGKLIRWAAKQFQDDCRDRIEEEWLAHLDDLPGLVAKLFHGVGCVIAASKIAKPARVYAQKLFILGLSEFYAPSLAILLVLDQMIEGLCIFGPGDLWSALRRFHFQKLASLGLSQDEQHRLVCHYLAWHLKERPAGLITLRLNELGFDHEANVRLCRDFINSQAADRCRRKAGGLMLLNLSGREVNTSDADLMMVPIVVKFLESICHSQLWQAFDKNLVLAVDRHLKALERSGVETARIVRADTSYIQRYRRSAEHGL